MRKITVCDSSLKVVGNEKATVLSFKEKLEIAKRLNELSVDCIEFNLSKNDKTDEVLIKTVCACVNKSVISCVAGNTPDEIKNTYALISGAKHKRLNVVMPVSPIQMEYALGKKPAVVFELLKTLTTAATSICDDVEVSLEDATRAEPEFLYKAVKTAIECGAKTVSVSDIAGTILPQDFSAFVKGIIDNVPEVKNINLTVATSDALAMGTANALSAIEAGANGVKVSTIKTETLPYIENVSSAIENIGVKRGYDSGLNKTALRRIVLSIKELAAMKDEKATEGTFNEKAETLDKDLTQSALNKIIRKRGYDLSPEDAKKVYGEFLRLSDKKAINTKELDAIIATCALQVPETYSLVSFSVNASNVLSATASITLKKDGEMLSGLSYGNGPVDAAFLAIEAITGRHIELDDFDLSAITEGKEAMGQAVIKLRHNGVIYSGRGISTDIIGSSIRAYLGALNKIVFEESKK